jgi:hypothetical protein
MRPSSSYILSIVYTTYMHSSIQTKVMSFVGKLVYKLH